MKNINILNNLNSGKTSSYSTTNGTKEFTCDNTGYVDNVVIEGETLVNLCYFPDIRDETIYSWFQRFDNRITGHDTYTVIMPKANGNIGFEVYNTENVGTKYNFDIDYNVGFRVVNIPKDHRIATIYASKDRFTEDEFKEVVKKTIIIAGDHTDKPISYFEGLKSVGQGDKIEVLTTPIHNNLIPQNYTKGEGYWNSMVDVGNVVSDSNWYRILEYIPVEPNTQYTGLYIGTQVVYYDENKNTIYHNQSDLVLGYEYHIFTTPQNAKYIRVSYPKDKEGNICIFEGVKHDKKQISTTLRSLPNGVKDTIEKRGNKYVKVQRCGEIVLDGSEIWECAMDAFYSTDNIGFAIRGHNTHNYILSDKFMYLEDVEGINHKPNIEYITSNFGGIENWIVIGINRSKLSTQDVAGFKQWLQANPTTVVYQLATPQIIELPNFNLQTYKGDNALLINSGAIQGDASFDVCEGIRSELDVIKDKISDLDDTTSTINYKNLRDDITFLNGWYIWGNEARFNCYVANDVVKICILLKPSVLTPYTPIFKLPKQYITQRKEFITCVDDNMRCYLGSIDEDGIFTFENDISSESTYVAINFIYPLIKKVI